MLATQSCSHKMGTGIQLSQRWRGGVSRSSSFGNRIPKGWTFIYTMSCYVCRLWQGQSGEENSSLRINQGHLLSVHTACWRGFWWGSLTRDVCDGLLSGRTHGDVNGSLPQAEGHEQRTRGFLVARLLSFERGCSARASDGADLQ